MTDLLSALPKLEVCTSHNRYDILIGHDVLADPNSFAGLAAGSHGVIVTNATVAPLWVKPLERALAGRHQHLSVVCLPDGEAHKDWSSLNLIFDHLLSHGCDRKTILYSLGGGVVGDITGFAAGCYMRGVGFVQIPTTLLAQVDSSVGGKTAINHPLGKNMVGVFHQPLRVVCDLRTLQTLPAREVRAGLAEVMKYGPIADSAFFDWLEAHVDKLLALDPQALTWAIHRSCSIKAHVVGQDEREDGLRAILNFGHTFGHAIETGVGYGQWLHGEAVACGMVLAARLSAAAGLIGIELAQRIEALVRAFGLPAQPPPLSVDTFMSLMRRDKKAVNGRIRFVLLRALGQAEVREVPHEWVHQVLEQALRTPGSPGVH